MQTELEKCLDALKQHPGGFVDEQSSLVVKKIKQELTKFQGLHLLSDRETQVFELIGRGLSVKEMAEQLELSPKTVETYRDRIRQATGCESAHKLTVLAVRWFAEKERS